MSNVASTMRRLNAYSGADSRARSSGNLPKSGSSPMHTRLPLLRCAWDSLSAKLLCTAHDSIEGYREKRIAQQVSYWTAISAAAGDAARAATYQQQRAETIFCDCRRMGTLAVAAMSPAQNSVPTSAAALPLGPSAAALCNSAGKSGAHC